MGKSAIVFKRKAKGEIEGYEVVQPAVPMYQNSGEVGGGEPVDSMQEVWDTYGVPQIYKDNIDEITSEYRDKERYIVGAPVGPYDGSIRDRVTGLYYGYNEGDILSTPKEYVQTQQALEREGTMFYYRDKGFNTNLYNEIEKLTIEQRNEILPPEARVSEKSRQQYSTTSSIYNRIIQAKEDIKTEIILAEQYNRDIFQAVLDRDKYIKGLAKITGDMEIAFDNDIFDLQSKSDRTEQEQKYLDKLIAKDTWSEGQAVLYESINDLNKVLGFDDPDFDPTKVTKKTKQGVAATKRGRRVNQWMTENIPVIGRLLGETYESSESLTKPGGSTERAVGGLLDFFNTLKEEEKEEFKDAAADLGYDLFNVFAFMALFTGAGGAAQSMLRKGMSQGVPVKHLVARGTSLAIKNYSKWAKLKSLGKITSMVIWAEAGIDLGTLLYDYGAHKLIGDKGKSTQEIMNDLKMELVEGIYGIGDQSNKRARRLAKAHIDIEASYPDLNSYLDQQGFKGVEDAWETMYPDKELPDEYKEYTLDDYARDLEKYEIKE